MLDLRSSVISSMLLLLPLLFSESVDASPVLDYSSCKRPQIEVRSGRWSLKDEKMLPTFHKRCSEIYGPDRCAIKVIKTKYGHMVICKIVNS